MAEVVVNEIVARTTRPWMGHPHRERHAAVWANWRLGRAAVWANLPKGAAAMYPIWPHATAAVFPNRPQGVGVL